MHLFTVSWELLAWSLLTPFPLQVNNAECQRWNSLDETEIPQPSQPQKILPHALQGHRLPTALLGIKCCIDVWACSSLLEMINFSFLFWAKRPDP